MEISLDQLVEQWLTMQEVRDQIPSLGANATIQHILSKKNAMSPMGFDPGTTVTTLLLPTELKEICTNTVSGDVYQPITVPITLGREAYRTC